MHKGTRMHPLVCPIATENGATWAPLPTREFVASLLAGYVNHLAGWILGHELPEPRRPAPVAGYNVQMHVVGPTAAYEFLRDICYRGDRNTLSADKRGTHMRTVDGDELYAVYHTVKDKVPTDIVDEYAALVLASQLPLATLFWFSMPDLPRPTAVATSWLDNAPASKKQLADAMLQIWGLPATTQLRALLAKHEDTVGCLDVRLLERILPARTTAHGMREFCHVDRDTWAARHLSHAGEDHMLHGQEATSRALLSWVQKINDVLWPIMTSARPPRLLVSDLWPAPAFDTVAKPDAPFPAPADAPDLGTTVMAVTPFHYRMSAALLMHWSGRRPEVIPKTLRAQVRGDSTPKKAKDEASSASGTTGSGSREPSPAPRASRSPVPERRRASRTPQGAKRQHPEAERREARSAPPRESSSRSPADRARGGRAREGTHRDRRVMHGNRVTVTASTAPAASAADEFAGLDDAAFAAVAREHGLELEDAPAPAPTPEETRARLLAEAERRNKRARVAPSGVPPADAAAYPPFPMGPPPPRPTWGGPPPALMPQMPGGGGYYWPPGMMYGPPMPGVTAPAGPGAPAPGDSAGAAHYQAAKNWRARLRLLLEAGNEASPPLLSEVLDEIATAAGHNLPGTTLPSGASWAALNVAATIWAAAVPSLEQFDRIESELLRLIGQAQARQAEGRCRPGARAVLRVYGDDEGEDDFATRAALQPRSIAESVMAAATREPQPLTDGPDRKTSAAPQSRSAALHASNSRQRSSLHFPTPAADPGDLTGYGPDRPSDLAVPESPEGAPPGGLNAPIPIAHVIDGISGRPHDFRRLQLQCPGFVYALNADGTLGASTRVQILFDTGAMGEVGEKRHMPPGTRYTGVKVLRAFLHHATITAEIAHVVLRFGDVYVSRAVYVVPDGSLGPNADLLVGIGTIMMVEGRIDTTSSGWCLHARDAQFRPHVIPFCCPDKRRGLSLSGSFALSS
eukprot:tig00000473_g1215.t1